jgi:uncharacterized protein
VVNPGEDDDPMSDLSEDRSPPVTPDGLVGADGRLVGSRCRSCAVHAFPVQGACPRCGSATEGVPLPVEGTLWSWTVQRTRPKAPYEGPEDFEPYAVGYVDLGPLKVEARLEGRDPDGWRIGEPLRLAPGPAGGDGNVWRFRFVPSSASGQGPPRAVERGGS